MSIAIKIHTIHKIMFSLYLRHIVYGCKIRMFFFLQLYFVTTKRLKIIIVTKALQAIQLKCLY